jgi:energy-coupling factor transporter ATP-binding protein EcfA2
MTLRSIKYTQFAGMPQEWGIDEFRLGQINLLVGKNAIGKTRTLNVINGLANLVCGESPLAYVSGEYDVMLEGEKDRLQYALHYEERRIIAETLHVNGELLLERHQGGRGQIKAIQLGQKMEFQAPDIQLASVVRRDSVQHPFFDDLFDWGKSCRHFSFGGELGRSTFAVFVKTGSAPDFNPKETDKAVALFKRAHKKYDKVFSDLVVTDMNKLGYNLEDIGVEPLPGVIVQQGPAVVPEGIYVKERDLKARVYQNEISQGMFRALSLIIHLDYAVLEQLPSCILIDDIGEGLDFERATSLIELMIEKAKVSSTQLVMSTNDRFTMNSVPLEYWSVIQREGGRCRVFNYENSKKIFDEFNFTGLANFDFLSSEFYLKGFDRN